MATIIDALTVELGLNPAPFVKGSKEALIAFTKTKDAAVTAGKTIEESSAKAADGIKRITTEVLTLFAVFLGARGIKEFISDVVSADAALGRFSANLGTSPQTIAAWGDAAERVGGTAEATSATFEKLGKTLNDFKFNGKALPDEFFRLESLAHMRIDTNDGIPRFLSDTAAALKRVYDSNPARAHFLAEGMGIDEGTANLMFQQGAAINAYVASLTNLTATGPQLKAAQDLQLAWVTLRQNAESLANELVRDLEPAIKPVLDSMTTWLTKNHDFIDSKINEYIADFVRYLKDPALWKGIGDGMSDFAKGAVAVAHAVDQIVAGIKWLAQLNEDSKSWGIVKLLNGFAGANQGGGPAVAAPSSGHGNVGGGTGTVNVIPGIHPKNGGTSVDGKPVSKSNPMPVLILGGDSIFAQAAAVFSGFSSNAGGVHITGGNSGFRTRRTRGGGGGNGGAPGIAYSATSLKSAMGLNDREYDAFREGVTDIEGKAYNHMGGSSGKYAGRYQMGPNEITETAKRLGVQRPTNAQFLADPALQERFFENYTLDHYEQLLRNPKFRAMNHEQQLKILGYAHNQGVGGALSYLNTGRAGSDAWGTSGTAYFGPIHRRYTAAMAAGAPSAGAKPQAALSTVQNNNRVTTSSTANEHNIGTINIHTQATDANGIASGISSAIKRNTTTSTANTGPQ